MFHSLAIESKRELLAFVLRQQRSNLFKQRCCLSVDRHNAVARLQSGKGGRRFLAREILYHHRYTVGIGKALSLAHETLHHIFGHRDGRFHAVAQHRHTTCFHNPAEGSRTKSVKLLAVCLEKDIAVLETNLVERFAVIHSVLHVLQRQVGLSPSIKHHGIDKQRQEEVEQHSSNHNHQTLTGRFGTKLIGLGRLRHGFLVHALVYHARNLAIASQRQPTDAILRVAVLGLEFEQREPRVEEKVELLYPDFENAGKNEMPELMHNNQYR